MGIYVGNYLVIVRMCLFFVIAPQMRNHLLAISRHSFRHCETYFVSLAMTKKNGLPRESRYRLDSLAMAK